MKQRAARRAKIIFFCPRCSHKKTVRAIETEHIIICPKCGAGMREKELTQKS